MSFSRRALSYFTPDRSLLGVLLLLTALGTGVGLLMAWPMAVLVDCVFGKAEPGAIHRAFLFLLPQGKLGQVIGLALIGLLLKLTGDLIGLASSIVSNHVNYRGLLRVRCDVYRKLQALNLDYHRSQPQGDAIYRLSTDTYSCQQILGVYLGLAGAVLTLVNILWIMLSCDWRLTLLALSITPVLALANVYFGKRFHERSLECKKHDAAFTTQVQRSMSCIGLIQAFGREHDEFGRFQGSIRDTIGAWWKLNRQQMAYNLVVGLTFGVGAAAVFGYGGWRVYQNMYVSPEPGGLSVGDLMVFATYLGMLYGPLCTITGFSTSLAGGKAGAARVFEILDRDPVIRDLPDAVGLPVQPRTITLENVWLGYTPGRPVLRGVDATIRPGEMVAFVGQSGVGKSTLLNLLPRFHDPSDGAMKLDGIDARRVRIADLRRHVALVLQESVILPTTVAENIAYGRPTATLAEVRDAATLAGAGEFIESLDDGYDAVIREGGANLSGGQRQRIAIARALLTRAPVVVLDEPTSALDSEHERIVIDALRSLKGSRTIVLVSHRLSSVIDCDRIFVMDAGRVVECGTHAELMALDGRYAAMAREQMTPIDAPPVLSTSAAWNAAQESTTALALVA
jgi:subfamily B ATP-binding cassette protein MsbA